MLNGVTSHIVALGLVLVALLTVLGGIWLASTGGLVPDSLIAIGSAATGALATLMNARGAQ